MQRLLTEMVVGVAASAVLPLESVAAALPVVMAAVAAVAAAVAAAIVAVMPSATADCLVRPASNAQHMLGAMLWGWFGRWFEASAGACAGRAGGGGGGGRPEATVGVVGKGVPQWHQRCQGYHSHQAQAQALHGTWARVAVAILTDDAMVAVVAVALGRGARAGRWWVPLGEATPEAVINFAKSSRRSR